MILFEKKYQTFDTVFHHQMKHLEVRQKYSAARRIFNSLLGVSSGDETLHLMFDILLQNQSSGSDWWFSARENSSFSLILRQMVCTPFLCLLQAILTENYNIFDIYLYHWIWYIKRPTVTMSRKKHLEINVTLVFAKRLQKYSKGEIT